MATKEELEARFLTLADGKRWALRALPHQWSGACFGAVARRFILGDDMGVGKTLTSIGWMDLVGAKRVLLIAEANICPQFAKEVRDWSPHRRVIEIFGLDPEKRKRALMEVSAHSEAVVVVNFDILRDSVVMGALLSWRADTVIIDEAHNIRNPATATFRTINRLLFTDNQCSECGGMIHTLSKPCPRCGYHFPKELVRDKLATLEHFLDTKSVKNICLATGTPLINSPEDLYSLIHLCRPDRFKSFSAYRKEFLKPSYISGSRRMVFKDRGMQNLMPLIKNFYIARNYDEVSAKNPDRYDEIPDQVEEEVLVTIDKDRYPGQYRIAKQVSEQARIALMSGESATLMHMITVILRQRQAVVYPAGITFKDPITKEIVWSVGQEVQESAKFDACKENILRFKSEGKRQIVFSQFTTALDGFKPILEKAGLRVAMITGKTTKKQREIIMEDFYQPKGKPKFDVVLAHYKSGGTGLNFIGATVTHMLDEEWSMAKKVQAKRRTHRIGQTNQTLVLVYRVKGSIDTWMSRLVASKGQMVDGFHSTMNQRQLANNYKKALIAGEAGDLT